jgi:hypothetical protein
VHSSSSQFARHFRRFCALLLALTLAPSSLALGPAFQPQRRVGFSSGDQWEPALAADGYGHVYILYPQYRSVSGCPSCPLPSMMLSLSNNGGQSWQPPHRIADSSSAQFDPQIVVDASDRRTVYASWLENHKHDIMLAKSADFGQSWSIVVAVRTTTEADKPVLAVRGPDVYAGFSQGRTLQVAASRDGGITFRPSRMHSSDFFPSSLLAGVTVDATGNVYFAWTGYPRVGRSTGTAALFISKSADGGATWNSTALDLSAAPPDCAKKKCGWSYLGSQIVIASDDAGTLYTLWNSGKVPGGPERIYFASSTTAGETWSPKMNVSTASAGVEHAFPAITAGAPGDVRIAWMDARRRPLWNTYYRSSTNGGASWSPEAKLSSFVPGYSYVRPQGFVFPFGDFFELDIDSLGQTHAVWGEGLNYESPGSIWCSSGR